MGLLVGAASSIAQPAPEADRGVTDPPQIVHEYVDFAPERRAASTTGTATRDGGRRSNVEGTTEAEDSHPEPGENVQNDEASSDAASEQTNRDGPNGDAALPSRAVLDEDTDSASGDPYDVLYDPTVRPHKRSQVLERIIFEDGILQLIEADPHYAPAAIERSSAALRVRRRAEIVIPELDRWYRLPTTTPDMQITRIESRAAVELRRSDTGIYELRVPTSPQALSGAVHIELQTSESRHYSGSVPNRVRLATPPDYRRLPAELLREVGTVLRSIPSVDTDYDSRESTLATLIDYFRAFRTAALSHDDPTRSLLYRTVTQQVGVCRHRAFGFVVLAQALGIRARYVANELHAFAEVQSVDGRWFRVDLGGLVEPGQQASAHTPATPSTTPPVQSERRADEQNRTNEPPPANDPHDDGERIEIGWSVDRQSAYRGDALVFSGATAKGPGTVSLVLQSTANDREIRQNTEVDSDGRWSITVILDGHWSVGSVAVTAYFEPDTD